MAKLPKQPTSGTSKMNIVGNSSKVPVKSAKATKSNSVSKKLTKPVPKPVSPSDKLNTMVHLADTTSFNLDHAMNHILEAHEHGKKLIDHIRANPDLAKSHRALHARVKEINKQFSRLTNLK